MWEAQEREDKKLNQVNFLFTSLDYKRDGVLHISEWH